MTQASLPANRVYRERIIRVLKRVLVVVLLGFTIGWLLHRVEAALEQQKKPAGFARGIVQGALMPLALPNLAFGDDVTIYAAANTGRTYKLGYTMGVNVCGLIFFGFFFLRLRKLKPRMG